MKHWSVVFILLAALVLPAQQSTTPPPKTDAEKKPAAPPPAQPVDEDMSEMIIPPGEYVYNPEGRRDPFWNQLLGKKVKSKSDKIEGIAGLTIDEIELEGILESGGVFRALVKGPDGRPYIIYVGDKVYDGVVSAINRYTITFKKVLEIAMLGQKESSVTKSLNPEEEEANKDENNN